MGARWGRTPERRRIQPSSESLSSLDSDNFPPEIEHERESEIHEKNDNENSAKFILSNAPSLAPKITSLIDYMYDLRCDFALITETWSKGGGKLDGELEDIEHASGIKLLCRNRPRRGGQGVGGGVALAFSKEKCNLKKRSIKTKFEILCVTGKISKIKRPFAIFTVYVPPKTKVAEFEELCTELGVAISEVKIALPDPVVIVVGDFNRRDPSPAFQELPDMMMVQTDPTRGNAILDLVYTNAGQEAFVDNMIEAGGEGKDFFAAVRKLSAPGKKSDWSVREIFPGRPDNEVCDEVLGYFTTVGGVRSRGACPLRARTSM